MTLNEFRQRWHHANQPVDWLVQVSPSYLEIRPKPGHHQILVKPESGEIVVKACGMQDSGTTDLVSIRDHATTWSTLTATLAMVERVLDSVTA